MKVLAALVVAASLLACSASAEMVCKGYKVKYSATDIKWADLSIETSLKSVGDYTITLDVSTDGEASFTIEIESDEAVELTKTLEVAGDADPYVESIIEVDDLCPAAPGPVAPGATPTTKCILVKATAGDYPWIVNAVKKALGPLASSGVTYTIAQTTGPAGYTYAKITITAPASQWAAIKAALKPDAYVISYTEVPCASTPAPRPVAPTTPRATKCILVKASAGDYPWIVNAVKKALGPLASSGVTYTIAQTTGPAGYTYAKITITAPASRWAAIKAALKPDAYVISYTEVACSATRPVAPVKPMTPITKCIIVKAQAGDYPWIVNAVKKALGPLGVKYTIAPRSGAAGYTYATITITAAGYTWTQITAALKPDAYIISYTEGPCVAPVVAPTCKPYIVKAKAGDYKWIIQAVQKALAPLSYQGVTFTLEQTTGAAGYTWAKLTVKAPASAWAAVDAALKPDAYVISYTQTGRC